MALNINAEHRLAEIDDSGISSVAVCLCGRSFIAVGPERVRDARYEHALHVYDAGGAMVGNAGRLRLPPSRDEFTDIAEAPRGRPAGGGVNAEERRAEMHQLRAEGLTAAEIALRLGLSPGYTRKVLSGISQDNLSA